MQYIKLKSRGSSVSFLQELLGKIDNDIPSSRCYNGAGYVANKYDVKMENAYLKFSTD